ncbi:MAG: DUF2182 domain-containing protein [Actinomycetota bacterium]|nr:DUF2182 domain-containing protein [Actinomycetota bacterium]
MIARFVAHRGAPAALLLVAVAALSWAYVIALEPHGMEVGVLLRPRVVTEHHKVMPASEMDVMDMSPSGTTSPSDRGAHAMALPIFLIGWIVMMAAMMLPAIVPVVMLVSRWSHSQGQPAYRLLAFIAGYLIVWCAAGVFYYALIELSGSVVPSPLMGVRVGAVGLLIAGLYQFAPLKERCLTACRSPLGFLMTHGGRMARGSHGYVEAGAKHGVFCLGCCWMMMVILVVLGVMNILWMVIMAGIIFIEKVARFGAGFSKLTGGAVTAVGVALIVAPGLII